MRNTMMVLGLGLAFAVGGLAGQASAKGKWVHDPDAEIDAILTKAAEVAERAVQVEREADWYRPRQVRLAEANDRLRDAEGRLARATATYESMRAQAVGK